ncbi:MAG: AzlC family ABC transporter permease [Gammaproteobacteria bacterium]|nr:AzlC family ABC transporter permease [Gammaproteobacteria bacterium]
MLALRDGAGFPGLILLTTMTGFGALAGLAGLSLPMSVMATILIWGLPGQLAMLELWVGGAGLMASIIACSLANARFLPMTVSFLPLLRAGPQGKPAMISFAQLLSLNSWAMCQRRFPEVIDALRWLYFVCFALTIISFAIVGTIVGFYGAARLPSVATIGLLFLNPLFFALVFAGIRQRYAVFALIIGAVLGPVTYFLMPDWSLILTGLVGGSIAFWITEKRAND